jgi:branched-chain amino acid transport system ATP-binding protein
VLLTLENINAYYDKSHVLQSVSLEIDQGEVVALLGRNGSGRSTTLKTIMGLVQAKSGTIRFHDKPITNHSPFSRSCPKTGAFFRT